MGVGGGGEPAQALQHPPLTGCPPAVTAVKESILMTSPSANMPEKLVYLFGQDHVLDTLHNAVKGWSEVGVEIPTLHHQLVPAGIKLKLKNFSFFHVDTHLCVPLEI